MNILIAYYSRTGGTEKLAEALKKEIEARGHSVGIEKVKPVKEHSFWGWWHIRMVKGECEIQPPRIKNVAKYDAICIGSPNWTRLSLPMARYLKGIEGLRYKNVGFFATTALWPPFEWYVFSAYLLDLTFSNVVGKKGGRIIDSLLLSSVFKNWSVNSEYGKKIIKNFCDKIEVPVPSYKDYFLKQKEVENTRLLIIIFSTFTFLSLICQIISSLLGKQIFTWNQYFSLFIITFFAYSLMLMTMERRAGVFLGKYFAGVVLVLSWTFTVLYLTPALGRPIILGYILFFIFISFFRELKAVLLTGLFTLLGYSYLFFNYPQKEVLVPGLDLTIIFLGLGVVSFITQNLQKHFINLLEAQDEIEMAGVSLEVKIEARTKELKELAETLDEQVKGRTKELQEKVKELEKFSRLSVGRELKMIELKKEIKKLKEKSEEKTKRSIETK